MHNFLVAMNIQPDTPEYAQAMQNFGLIAGKHAAISQDEWDNLSTGENGDDEDDASALIEWGVTKIRWTLNGESDNRQYLEKDLHPDDIPGKPSFKFEHMDFNKDSRISNGEFDQYLSLHGINPQSPQYAKAWAAFGQLKASPSGVALDKCEYNNKAPVPQNALGALREMQADTSLINLFNISDSKSMEELFAKIAGTNAEGNKNEITESEFTSYVIQQGIGPKLAERIATQVFSLQGLPKSAKGGEKVITAAIWPDAVVLQYLTLQIPLILRV